MRIVTLAAVVAANEEIVGKFKRALTLHQEGQYPGEALALYHEVIAQGEVLTAQALSMACTNAGALELAVTGDATRAGALLARASALTETAAAFANECALWLDRDAGRAEAACRRALELDPAHEAAAASLASLTGERTSVAAAPRPPLHPDDVEATLAGVDFERLFEADQPPFVWHIKSVLSSETCQQLVATGNRLGWTTSATTGDAAWRTSQTVSLPWDLAGPLLDAAVGRRGTFRDDAEPPQLVRYLAGGYFATHSDATTDAFYRRREATLLFYLSDASAECATRFPFVRLSARDRRTFPRFDLAAALALVPRQEERNATLDVVPRAGDALLFVNVDLETRTKPDALALHVREPRTSYVIILAGGAPVPMRRQACGEPVVSVGLT